MFQLTTVRLCQILVLKFLSATIITRWWTFDDSRDDDASNVGESTRPYRLTYAQFAVEPCVAENITRRYKITIADDKIYHQKYIRI